MCFKKTSIPVYQYTSIPVAAVTHATPVLMTALWMSTPLAAVEIEPVIYNAYTITNRIHFSYLICLDLHKKKKKKKN